MTMMRSFLFIVVVLPLAREGGALVPLRLGGYSVLCSDALPLTSTSISILKAESDENNNPTTTAITSNDVATTTTTTITPTPPVPVDAVRILPDADAVGMTIREYVRTEARRAIQDRGHFALAIPGGSILKMLVGTGRGEGNDDDDDDDDTAWTSRTTVVYVNHKCVAMDDMKLATHAKAQELFLKDWKDCNVIVMDGTDDGPREASTYEQKLKNLSNDVLPRAPTSGLPIFDLALIGVGDDGHVGSLYPGRDEVLITDGSKDDDDDDNDNDPCPWVLSVAMKQPPSITLSLPVMKAAKQVIVAACGVSEKYPQGKSAAMKRAIVNTDETVSTFPAVGLRSVATWVMDEAAASQLGDVYNT